MDTHPFPENQVVYVVCTHRACPQNGGIHGRHDSSCYCGKALKNKIYAITQNIQYHMSLTRLSEEVDLLSQFILLAFELRKENLTICKYILHTEILF